MCVIFLSVSVIILFVYYGDWSGTAAASEIEPFVTLVSDSQSLSFVTGGSA